MTKKIFSFLNDGETLEENKDTNSIQNSMTLSNCAKRKERNCRKELLKNEKKRNSFSFLSGKRSVTKKIFSFLNDGETSEENQRHQENLKFSQ